jgi:hypothetical protein
LTRESRKTTIGLKVESQKQMNSIDEDEKNNNVEVPKAKS